jgi:DNA repair photolyase
VNIQTKSRLALRDLDLFQAIREIEVGFTVTTDDERVARLFEPLASSVQERLDALSRMHAAGIKTFAFIGPVLPGNPELLVERLEGKADRVLIDRMNYLHAVRGFYGKMGMRDAGEDSFFSEQRDRLASALEKKGMAFEILF